MMRAQTDNPLLEIDNLTVQFTTREGRFRAVNGVNLMIRCGEIVGLVGESGCGKSMTARAVLGLVPKPGRVSGGRILWHRSKGTLGGGREGEPTDLAKLDPKGTAMRRLRGEEIAMIFQEPMSALSPVYTVGNQIIETIMLHRKASRLEAKERAIDLLGLVGIPDPHRRIDAYPFQLSGGMCQRVMIASALACNPSLLIADEPTTALDVTIQAQILELLQKLQEELGMAILLISHNLGVVATMAHRVAVMYLGEVVEEAPTSALFAAPKHPYTKGLLKSIPQLGKRAEGELYAIPGRVPPPYARIPGCPFHPRCEAFMPGKCEVDSLRTYEVGHEHSVRCFLHEKREVVA